MLGFHIALTVMAIASATETVPERVTLCDLARNPERYSGKLIQVRAKVLGRTEPQLEAFSRNTCPAYIQVLLVYPSEVRPAPDFDLGRDQAAADFARILDQGMMIEATLTGRFDTAIADSTRRVPKGKGFGKRRLAAARLVLLRVSDVVARPRPRL